VCRRGNACGNQSLRLLVIGITTLLTSCIQSRVGAFAPAAIVRNGAGFLIAGPGSRMVFESGRMVHYPLPFVWSGSAFLWEVDSARVIPGTVLTLPDPAVTAVYQPFGHPMKGGYYDIRGTIRIESVHDGATTADINVRSDSAGWSMRERREYRRRVIDQ
jgi:hypothetical protein